jgi:hypothetical protein
VKLQKTVDRAKHRYDNLYLTLAAHEVEDSAEVTVHMLGNLLGSIVEVLAHPATSVIKCVQPVPGIYDLELVLVVVPEAMTVEEAVASCPWEPFPYALSVRRADIDVAVRSVVRTAFAAKQSKCKRAAHKSVRLKLQGAKLMAKAGEEVLVVDNWIERVSEVVVHGGSGDGVDLTKRVSDILDDKVMKQTMYQSQPCEFTHAQVVEERCGERRFIRKTGRLWLVLPQDQTRAKPEPTRPDQTDKMTRLPEDHFASNQRWPIMYLLS